jgi:Calcineurin-like phosphoesterase
LLRNVQGPQTEGKTARVPDGTRIYAIGDIHGRADLLDALFKRIDESLKDSPVEQVIQVLLGDYIDRGPNSRDVIDILIARRQQQHITFFLKGNHENYLMRLLSDPSTLPEWLQAGGVNTLLSYGVRPAISDDVQGQEELVEAFRGAFPDNHRRFMQGLALSFTCGDYFFAHAGVRPGIPLNQQHPHDLLWIREDFLRHEADFGKIVVHGHTPARQPEIRSNRINIDTGAYATGLLTCLVLQGDGMVIL